MPRRLLATLVAALVLLAPQAASATGAPDPAAATDGPMTWAVVPADETGPDGRGRIDLVVEPGDVYLEHVAIRNLSEQPLVLELAALEATQAADGSYQLLEPTESSDGIRLWTRLETTRVTVPPRSHVVVAVVLDIPADAEPGDHAGGIVAAATVEQAATGSVRYQTGTRIGVRVSGPVKPALGVDGLQGRYDGVLNPFGTGTLDIEAAIANAGTVRLTPSATVRVSGPFGWWSGSRDLDGLGEMLPGAAVPGAVLFEGVPPLGPLEVVVEFPEVSSAGQEVTGITRVESVSIVVWAVPWSLLVGIAVLLLAVVAVVVVVRRRARLPGA